MNTRPKYKLRSCGVRYVALSQIGGGKKKPKKQKNKKNQRKASPKKRVKPKKN